MKKQTKAAIAAGAGAILLLGGAGSLAYWNDSSETSDGTISSGQLSLDDCVDGGTWTDVNNATPIDIADFRIVPGDTVSYTCNTVINATGDNLTATLTADIGGITGNTALLAALGTPLVTATANGTDLPTGETGVQIAPAETAQSIVVTVSMTFDPATIDTIAQNETVDLSATTLVLQQNDNP